MSGDPVPPVSTMTANDNTPLKGQDSIAQERKVKRTMYTTVKSRTSMVRDSLSDAECAGDLDEFLAAVKDAQAELEATRRLAEQLRND